MKNPIKLFAAIALTGLTLTTVNAQTNPPTTQTNSSTGAQFGVKGGVNFSNIYSEDVDDNNVLTSFNAGVYATFPVGDILSIQPEVLYSRKGAKLTYDNAFVTGETEFKLNYIEVPVLFKVNITENLNVHAGPYFAYLVDAQVKNESDGGDFEDNYDNDDFNKFDVGISGGIGLEFSFIEIGARYNYGFTTIGKEREVLGTTYTIPDGKNSSLSVYAAFKLN
ncbi:MAG: porin family protein [Bacteroidota bacterium]